MKNKILTLSIIVLFALTTIIVISAAPVKAAAASNTQWITKYTITDSTGNVILSKDLTTGSSTGNGIISNSEELEVTVTINVATSNPSSSLTLTTAMAHSGTQDHYWSHDVSDGYSLGDGYNPNSASFSFTQNAGTLTISCYGQATGQVETTANGITLHIPVPLSLITLSDPSGSTLDSITLNITDASINNYNSLLTKEQSQLSSLQSSGVDPGYVQIFQNVITQSQSVASSGLTDQAGAMLNSLASSSAPASATLQILFIPLIAVVAVIAVLFAFLFMRSRSKVNYFHMIVEDQIKDLEGLTLRASKLDRTMGSNLDSVKERLKRLVGM
jgi:hypothetical protein